LFPDPLDPLPDTLDEPFLTLDLALDLTEC